MTVIISDGVLSEVHGLYVFFGGGLTKGSPLSLKLYEILMEILIILKPLRGIAQQPVLTHNKGGIKMAIFKGAGVAIVTPMHEDLSINYDKLEELLEEQIAAGTDAIIICGTTGESATLSEEEHLEAIKFTIDKVAKRIPVIAGTGSNSTHTAVNMSKDAAEYGADGLLIVTPYYNKGTQNGLIRHYTTIAEAAKNRSSCIMCRAGQGAISCRQR